MVLAELGQSIANALNKLGNAPTVDEKLFEDLLKEIGNSLIKADVNISSVIQLRKNVKTMVDLQRGSGVNERKIIQKSVFDELVKLVSSKKDPYTPVKNRSNVIMFVGLQGSGKTTTIAKYAYYYKRKGWKVAMVCADTFRAGAFDQLKQNASRIKVPFYGSYTEADPVKIADEGVHNFKKEGYEIIIIDTSGRHKQESALFDEMKEIQDQIKPNDIIFIMDSSIGQNAFDQAKAFHNTVPIGSVVLTKLDGHAKGGGALSAVSATGSPIIFIGTGEHFDQFEKFESKSFISRLLGMGDIQGLVKEISENGMLNPNKEEMQRLSKGQFTFRDMRSQLEKIMQLGSVQQIMSMIPGLPQGLIQAGKEQEGIDRMKRFIFMMDSMTEKELDGKVQMIPSRVLRIARGSGTDPREVDELFACHKAMGKMVGTLGKSNLLSPEGIMKNSRNPNGMLQNLMKGMDPRLLSQMGGPQNIMNMMKQFGSGGLGGIGDMAKKFGLG